MRTSLLLASAFLASLVGCGGAPVGPAGVIAERPEAPGVARSQAEPCAPRSPGRLRAASTSRSSGSVALVHEGARTVAFVADEEGGAIVAFDVDQRAVLASTSIEGGPTQLLALDDGRLAVSLREGSRVVVLEAERGAAEPLARRCETPVAAEPIALASTPDGRRLVVTSGWSHALTVLRAADLAREAEIDLPREPRAVLVDDTGETAHIAHAIGSQISVVDLRWHGVTPVDLHRDGVRTRWELPGPRDAGQGYALVRADLRSRPDAAPRPVLFAPGVSIDPGKGVFSTEVYGPAQGFPVLPVVHVVDEARGKLLSRASNTDELAANRRCNLPRAAAIRGHSLFVACLGVDAVLELDTRAGDPMDLELRRFDVPAGPTGLAIDDGAERAVVWSAFAHRLAVLDLGPKAPARPVATIDAPRREGWLSGAIARGRELFHATRDPRISGDGRGCVSCHADGREDGLVWATPAGPRQTIMLAGRVEGSAPFGWTGARRDLPGHIRDTWRRLGGRGVFAPSDRDDLDALAAYVASMKPPPVATSSVREVALVARGRDLFEAPAQGCSSCHPGGHTDGLAHDVGSDAFHRPFDTPSLRFVARTAPYFHDGRFATLDDLLRGADGTMGHTAHLSDDDRRALVAYLETL